MLWGTEGKVCPISQQDEEFRLSTHPQSLPLPRAMVRLASFQEKGAGSTVSLPPPEASQTADRHT